MISIFHLQARPTMAANISWGERNTAVTTYFGENEFFTKMNTIYNVTDSDKFLKLLYNSFKDI